MNTGVIYYLSGPSHTEALRVSLWSLRRYYNGAVTILFTRDTRRSARNLAYRYKTKLIPVDHPSSFPGAEGTRRAVLHSINKCACNLLSPYERTVYLDADTLVEADISELFEYSLAFTTSDCHLMDKTRVANRAREKFRGLRRRGQAVSYLANRVLAANPILVNTGGYAFQKGHPIIKEWFWLSLACLPWSMLDEHTLLMAKLDSQFPVTILGSEWNAVRELSSHWTSPKKIRHFVQHSWPQSGTWKKARLAMIRSEDR